VSYRIKQEYKHFKIMNSFTALKNLSPFHFTIFSLILSTLHFTLFCYTYLQLASLNFTSLHFFIGLSYQPFTSLYFTVRIYNSLRLTSLHFTFYRLILSTLHFTLFCYTYLQLTSLNFTSLHFLSAYPINPSLQFTLLYVSATRFA